MNRSPKSVRLALIFILLDAGLWLFYAFLMAFGGIRPFAAPTTIRWVLAALALGCSAALAGTAILLRKHNRFAYFGGLVLLEVVAILSITDEIGLADFSLALISFIPIVLMLKDRGWYLRQNNGTSKQEQDG